MLYSSEESGTKWCLLAIEEDGNYLPTIAEDYDDITEVLAQALYECKGRPEDTSLIGEFIPTDSYGFYVHKKEVECDLIDAHYKVIFYTITMN